uniref:Uncharacterized protein n=1 Tax=Parascaris univalens TaxID=6257 RepID=A0A915CJW5_PARUN
LQRFAKCSLRKAFRRSFQSNYKRQRLGRCGLAATPNAGCL